MRCCRLCGIGITDPRLLQQPWVAARDPCPAPTSPLPRDLNKWTYLKCAVDTLSPTADLSLHLSVTADGRPVPLPRSAAGLIVLNVTSYGAGADLWGTPAHFRPQSYGTQDAPTALSKVQFLVFC